MNPDIAREITLIKRRLDEIERGRGEVAALVWQAAVPTVTQAVNVTFTSTHAEVFVLGRMVMYTAFLDITGAGTTNNNIVITVPAAYQPVKTGSIGTGYIFDTSTGGTYFGVLVAVAGNDIRLRLHSLTTATFFGVNPNFGLASGDVISIEGQWRIA